MTCQSKYEAASHQLISKSSYTTSQHCSPRQKGIITSVTRFQDMQLQITYLGIPLYKGYKKSRTIAKNENQIIGPGKQMPLCWRQDYTCEKFSDIHASLSLTDPQTIQLHCKEIRKDLLSSCGRIHLHAGGFTFGWNLWWKFKAQESLWAWVMKAKQCQNSHPRIAQPRSHDSYNWRILLAVRGDAKLNITWRLGAGKISFQYENQLGHGPLHDLRIGSTWHLEKLRKMQQTKGIQVVKIPPYSTDNDEVFGH